MHVDSRPRGEPVEILPRPCPPGPGPYRSTIDRPHRGAIDQVKATAAVAEILGIGDICTQTTICVQAGLAMGGTVGYDGVRAWHKPSKTPSMSPTRFTIR